ncbi:MAG: hypothetical protein ACMG51_00885 [Ginsengibacter sp.]
MILHSHFLKVKLLGVLFFNVCRFSGLGTVQGDMIDNKIMQVRQAVFKRRQVAGIQSAFD